MTNEELTRWRDLCAGATPITKIVTSEGVSDAMFLDDGFEFSCATFDRQEDALVFASAAPIITRLLDEVARLRAEVDELRTAHTDLFDLATLNKED